jgi:hypothetical protein
MVSSVMSRAETIATITDQLTALDDERVNVIATMVQSLTESVRPLSAREQALLAESKREFSEGRSFSLAESRAQVDAVLAVHGVPRSA